MVIGVRLMWQFTVVYLIRAIDRREVQRERRAGLARAPGGGWAGMRGSVSLAAALALPLTTDGGAPFPERDLIIFLAFAVHARDAGRAGADARAADPAGSA